MAAALIYIQVAKLIGAGARNMRGIKTASLTAGVGVATVAMMMKLLGSSFIPGAGLVALSVLGISLLYTALSYKDYSREVFAYSAGIWQPVDGGKYCGDCNKMEYGCSEYQCHSFGKSCEIINKGSDHEECAWINKNDILPPTLTPMNSALPSADYHYVKSNSVLPGEHGVKITYKNDDCLPPFTDVDFGVRTNEPAECKIDTTRKSNMSLMSSYMLEGAVSIYNHTIKLPAAGFPTAASLKASGFNVENQKDYRFFIRCKDTNGNPTPSNFLVNFCIQKGPDTMAPVIIGTNYLTNSPISYNNSVAPLEVYVNEPADCRWDFRDTNYDQMEHNMSDCSQKVGNYLIPQTFTYGCRGNVTGIRDGKNNTYYIRCKDKPWWKKGDSGKRFANQQSYELNLIGTEPLQIDNITINGKNNGALIVDSVNPTKVIIVVKTSAGAKEGNARCQ